MTYYANAETVECYTT